MKFRKKPVVVEAVQFIGWNTNHQEVTAFVGADATWSQVAGAKDPVLFIDTLEGKMMASPGDWIIKGVAGEFYPCKPEIFDKTYERV